MYQVMVQYEPFKPHTYWPLCFGGCLGKPGFSENLLIDKIDRVCGVDF
jgi:hypothetical protein